MIASNTKSMTTLLLATLVDEGKLSWDTPVVQVMPDFKLGDPETTKQVLVRHLVCACTGLPRQTLDIAGSCHSLAQRLGIPFSGSATLREALGVVPRQ